MIIRSGSMTQHFKTLCTAVLPALIVLVAVLPAVASAQGFIPLVGLPGLENTEEINKLSFNDYLNALLRLAIIAGALIAVVKLIMAGVQYVLSGIVTDKADAKKDIYAAILGLMIIILAVVILNTINKDLTSFGILPNAPSFEDLTRETEIDLDSTERRSFVEYCASEAGNCALEECSGFDIPIVLEGAYAICETICENRGGIMVGKGIFDSGKCYYPVDDDASELAELKITSDAIKSILPDSVTVTEETIAVTCEIQVSFGGRSVCGQEEDDCEDGDLLPSGEAGVPEIVELKNGSKRNKVLVCTPE